MNLRAFLPFLLPPGTVDEHVVDNRVFLLGLDQLYRERVKRHESTELLTCARAVAARLNVAPAAVPIEGYYTETKELTEYFRLTRGLQSVGEEAAPHVAGMPEFQRLLSVVSSPLYGRPVQEEERRLLPAGRDPLSQALHDTGANPIDQWTVANLVERSNQVALEGEDFSLVGLASIVRDAVILAASRESVVLYAERVVVTSALRSIPRIPVYVWRVDEELSRRAARFVATFNELFDEDLPKPVAKNAALFFEAADAGEILGRCVCLGGTLQPKQFYHWAINRGSGGRLVVEDFWDAELWTTKRYRNRRRTPAWRAVT